MLLLLSVTLVLYKLYQQYGMSLENTSSLTKRRGAGVASFLLIKVLFSVMFSARYFVCVSFPFFLIFTDDEISSEFLRTKLIAYRHNIILLCHLLGL